MGYIRDEMIKPIFIGGIVGGVLFSISILSYYCLSYVLSGAITAYLIGRKFDPTDKDYIIAGGLSGGIAGLVSWCLDTLIILMLGIPLLANYCSPDEIYMEMMIATEWLMMNIPLYLLIGIISGAIGGILYGKLRRYMVR